MDGWAKLNKTLLPEKVVFYSLLNMEDTIDADYALAERVYKNFEIKNLAEYHDLYVQSDALLLADVFENSQNMCFELYEFDPANTFFSSWTSTASNFKKDLSRVSSFKWYSICY